MADDHTTPRFLDRLAADVEAILDGREPDGDPEPTDAGVDLGVALRIRAGVADFRVSWDPVFPGCARLGVGADTATWLRPLVEAAGAQLYQDDHFPHTWFVLLTEDQAHDVADRIRARYAK
jgi:hypothetical protein